MYVYPDRLSSEILDFIRDQKKVCHYLDMPLQHISDNILKMMNRRSTGKSIRKKIADIRKTVPDIAFRTTFIVGFPGETEKDFEELRRFVADTRFDNVGVFRYSRETGTSAAGLPGQLPEHVKTFRMEDLVGVQSRIIDKINQGLAGRTVKVLLDSPAFGRTYRDAPDIDGKVEIIQNVKYKMQNKKCKAGEFIDVKITGSNGYLRRGIPA